MPRSKSRPKPRAVSTSSATFGVLRISRDLVQGARSEESILVHQPSRAALDRLAHYPAILAYGRCGHGVNAEIKQINGVLWFSRVGHRPGTIVERRSAASGDARRERGGYRPGRARLPL